MKRINVLPADTYTVVNKSIITEKDKRITAYHEAGHAVSAYYLEKQLTVIPENVFLPMLLPAIISLITYLLVRFFPKIKKFVLAISTIGTIAMLIAFAVLWIKNGYEFHSFAFFNSVFTLFYVVVDAVTVGEYDRLVIRDISFGSFGIFLVIALVVLFIIILVIMLCLIFIQSLTIYLN